VIIIQYEEQIMLSFETIKRIMKTKSNGRQISDKAVVLMSIYVEKYVKNVTEKSLEVLDEMNKNRKIQNIRLKKRLNDNCIRRGARIINYDCLYNNNDDDGLQSISNTSNYKNINEVEII